MLDTLKNAVPIRQFWQGLLPAAVLLAAAILGYRPSPIWLLLPLGLAVLLILLRHPLVGLPMLIVAALAIDVPINTGTEVSLNAAVLTVTLLLVIWLLNRMRDHNIHLVRSRVNLPLALFLLSGLLSVFIGNVTWDPAVPKSDNFIIVQLAQWAMWFFSAVAFWLAGNTIKHIVWLRRLTVCYIVVAGLLAIVRVLPGGVVALENTVTLTVDRAPFWLLLTALIAGQLLFNREISSRQRLAMLVIMGAVVMYSFGVERARMANWVSVVCVVGTLIWLRFPRVRLFVVGAALLLIASGVLFQYVYDFAGGDAKWEDSGGSRLALIDAVLEVSMRNPITGLGPAAYRAYGKTISLQYEGAFYASAWLSSHNNYVDIFSQTGILGLGLFLWFMLQLLRLGMRLRKHYTDGFAGGYVNGMIAAWVGIIVIMALADWFLPFVYNIGFPGFQASVLVWMFLGGLIALEQMAQAKPIEAPSA
jgi:hypothetical protein